MRHLLQWCLCLVVLRAHDLPNDRCTGQHGTICPVEDGVNYPRGARKCYANWIFLGTMRSGTSTLAHKLGQHPHIQFFHHNSQGHIDVKGAEEDSWLLKDHNISDRSRYFERLPCIAEGMNSSSYILGHYKPSYYLFDRLIPQRLRSFFPNAAALKFVVMVRDPVEARFSLFASSRIEDEGTFDALAAREINESTSYSECVLAQLSGGALASSADAISDRCGHASQHVELQDFIYHVYLRRWMYGSFFKATNFHIISDKEFNDSPLKLLHDTVEFLGADPDAFEELYLRNHFENSINPFAAASRLNALRVRKNVNTQREHMSTQTAYALRSFYQPHNALLYGLVRRDLQL